MPDNVGVNRQQNRQQKALVERVTRCWSIQYSIAFFSCDDVEGYRDKTVGHFRPPSHFCRVSFAL